MRSFAGDESVHSLRGGLVQFRTRTASHDPDAFALFAASRKECRAVAKRDSQPGLKFLTGDEGCRLLSDRLAFRDEKWLLIFQSNGLSELRVVAEFRMG